MCRAVWCVPLALGMLVTTVATAASGKDEASRPVHAGPSRPGVEAGAFPKSFEFPGTGISFSIVGYAKVDLIQDFDAVGNHFEFKTNTIAIDGTAAAEQDGQTTLHARESRIGLDVRGEDRFRVYVEGDFFGDNSAFRLRHAYGELGDVLGGQTWTTFMDISTRPMIVDMEGPDGEVFVRRALVRYHRNLNDRVSAAVGVENPTSQFVVPGSLSGSIRAELPEVPGYVRVEGPPGHVQVAGIWRPMKFDGTSGSADANADGWGVNGTFKAKVQEQNELMGQLAHGQGIASLISGLQGLNLDAFFTPAGDLDALPATGWLLGYTHHFSPAVRAGVAYSQSDLDADDAQPGSTIVQTQDARASLWWTPHKLVDYAIAVLWGRVEERSGADGDAVRLQLAAKYAFN